MDPESEKAIEVASQKGGSLPSWIMAGVALYLLPFLVVLVDEVVLKTYWFDDHLPPKVGEVMRAVYPFYRFFDQ